MREMNMVTGHLPTRRAFKASKARHSALSSRRVSSPRRLVRDWPEASIVIRIRASALHGFTVQEMGNYGCQAGLLTSRRSLPI